MSTWFGVSKSAAELSVLSTAGVFVGLIDGYFANIYRAGIIMVHGVSTIFTSCFLLTKDVTGSGSWEARWNGCVRFAARPNRPQTISTRVGYLRRRSAMMQSRARLGQDTPAEIARNCPLSLSGRRGTAGRSAGAGPARGR